MKRCKDANKFAFSPEEDKILISIASLTESSRNWLKTTEIYNSKSAGKFRDRPTMELFKRFNELRARDVLRNEEWTPKEIDRLEECIEKYGLENLN